MLGLGLQVHYFTSYVCLGCISMLIRVLHCYLSNMLVKNLCNLFWIDKIQFKATSALFKLIAVCAMYFDAY